MHLNFQQGELRHLSFGGWLTPPFKVSGVRFRVSEKNDKMRNQIILDVIEFVFLTPDT
jgi:hypothetical protein